MSPAEPPAPREPRYRRLLTFGDNLDESVRLYRQHFVTFALVSAIALLPSGLILVWASAAGILSTSFTALDVQPGGRFGSAAQLNALNAQAVQQLGAAFLTFLISGLFSLLWTAALVVTCDAYIRGDQPSLVGVYGRALKRLPIVLLSTLLFAIGLVAATALASVLLVLTVFGLVGSLIALIGLLFWWLRPSSRKPWLKWLIVLTTPFGLPTYLAIRWSLYLAAIVIEDRGSLAALSRSTQLTAGNWFRVASILTVAPLIVGILVSVITLLVTIPLSIASSMRGQLGLDPASSAMNAAVSTVLQILFSSVAVIVYALLFNDLRNRREGTDIVERVSRLEASPLPANA